MQLPETIIMVDDLRRTMRELGAYMQWYASAVIHTKVIGENTTISEPPSLSPATIHLVQTDASPLSAATLEALYAKLQTMLDSAQELTITVAAPPTLAQQRQIASWCRHELGASVFVRFRFDAALCGGLTVQAGSHIYDWSVRRAILDNRSRFAEVLRRV